MRTRTRMPAHRTYRVFLLGLTLYGAVGLASQPQDEMSHFFSSTTRNFVSAMQSQELARPAPDGVPSPQAAIRPHGRLHFSFYSIKLRIRPRVGFKIPAMLTLSLVPELELSWTKRSKVADHDGFGH